MAVIDVGGMTVNKSDVYKAIVKIQEYCLKQNTCECCDLNFDDELYGCSCLLNSIPSEWGTDDIPFNLLERSGGGINDRRVANGEK